MDQSNVLDERSARNLRMLRIGALFALVAMVLAANVILFRQIDVQMARAYTAEADNTTWNLSQIEVELLRFEAAVYALRAEPQNAARLEDLKFRFDLLFSRMEVASKSKRLSETKLTSSKDWQRIAGPDGLVATLVPFVDGPTSVLMANLDQIASQTRDAVANIRDEIVSSSTESIRQAEVQRHELRASLQLFSAVALGLMGLMAAMIIVIFLQGRAREGHRKELAQAVYNLRTTIDSSLEAAVILDHDGRIIGCNRAGAAMFDLRDDGRTVRYLADRIKEIAPGGDGITQLVRQCSEDPAQARVKLTGLRADGSKFPMELSIARAKSAVGLPISIAFVRDISEIVEREEALRAARNAALRGEEAKSRFLAMMSHEMRTPLNGLLSAVELLKSNISAETKQGALVRVIENCGRTTLEQVNNVLDLTSLRSVSEQDMPTVDFSPATMVESIAEQFKAEAAIRRNDISVVFMGQVPHMVRGRITLVQRVLQNLVSNAVKFTEGGKITISVDGSPSRQKDSVALRIAVEDTGAGIAEEDLNVIFDAFETLDSSYSRLRQGSGLGLGLAKLAAEAMGGRITVSSRKGFGSIFALYLTLPIVSNEAETPNVLGEGQDAANRALSLLVVEDNPVNLELLCEILRLKGHRVVQAKNGVEAVDLAGTERLDAILMDVSMPIMDGLEATKKIRSQGRSKNIPIIAVTANSDSHSPEHFRSVGMNAVVSKPVDFRMLEDVLHSYIPVTTDAEPDQGAKNTKARSPKASGKRLDHLRLVSDNSDEDGAETAKAEPAEKPQNVAMLIDDAVFEDLRSSLGDVYIAKLTARYVDETETALTDIDGKQAEGDLIGAAAIAHKNAGAAASLGLKAMHRVLVAYEMRAKAGDKEAAAAHKSEAEQVKEQTFALLRERGLTA